jgi:hypothetical protein
MSFVAIANPPDPLDEPVVRNDGWFPDLEPAQMRAACRLDGTVTTARLIPALQAAMLSVNAELRDWQAGQRAQGRESLADVPAPTLGEQSALALRYQRAVQACLQADLLESYRSLTTLPDGINKDHFPLDAITAQIDEQRRKQRWAISDLLGIPRSTVELI